MRFCALSADFLRVKAHQITINYYKSTLYGIKLCAECKNFCIQRTAFLHLACKSEASQRQAKHSCKLPGRAFREALKRHKKGMTCRPSPSFIFVPRLFKEKLSYCCDVVTAIHPCVATAWEHGLMLDTSVLEVILKLDCRLLEEV